MTRPRPRDTHRRLGHHLLAVVRAQDAAIPAHRRVPRTAAQMRARFVERTSQTATMREDACPLCFRWSCDGTDCPPSAAPEPAAQTATASAGDPGWGQCNQCMGWFPDFPGGVCSACRALGR
ncbi:hypothetical protein [Streptomyces sp. NPDC058424]|uniref:hypothetical protein n=1 Tax=Streptomyces sp. NPDC058424 TaxID=3346491 RepID=UPI0036638952